MTERDHRWDAFDHALESWGSAQHQVVQARAGLRAAVLDLLDSGETLPTIAAYAKVTWQTAARWAGRWSRRPHPHPAPDSQTGDRP